MRTPRALWFFLIAAATACSDSTSPAPASGLDAATVQQLLERLDRLVAAVESTKPAAAPVSEVATGTPQRTLVADANSDLVARIEALERKLLGVRDRSGLQTPTERVITPPPMEPAAVQRYAAQMQGKDQAMRQEARRSLFQLTEQQILQQFGTPTWTSITQTGHVQWAYSSEQANLGLTFVDGRVVVID